MLHAGYRKGSDADKQANRAIWEDAERRLWNDPAHDIGENWFVANYGIGPSRTVDEDVLANRMHFVCDPAGEPIATITAWFAEGNPASLGGVVHNVAIKSSHGGKGLSKPLMAAVLLRTEPGQFIPPLITGIRPYARYQDELVRTVQYRTGMLAGRDSLYLATRQYIEESASDVKQPTKRQVGDWLKGEKGFQRQKTSGVALPKGGVGSGGLHNFALVIAKSLPTSSYVFMHHTNDW